MIDAYLRELESLRRSPHTIANYRYTFRDFDAMSATEDDVRAFLLSAPSAATAGLHFRHLRAFYNWAEKRGIRESPVKYMSAPRETIPVIQPYSEEEIRRMMASRIRMIVTLLLTTGIRRGEATRLTRADIRGDVALIRGKGRRERYVPISESLQALLPQRDPIVGLTPHGLYEAIQALGKRVGVRAWPHRFRDTFAVRYLERGGSIDNLQVLLGHSHIQTTLRYVAYGREQRALDEARRLMAS